MADTKKRQNIILIATAIVVLYGIFQLIGSTAKHAGPDTKVRATDLQSFVSQTTAGISMNKPSEYDLYVVNQAENAWKRNPFSRKNRPETGKDISRKPLFIYEGYIESGNRHVAIINDNEYVAGEPLEQEGFFLKKVSPSSVSIENKKEQTQIEVPLSE